MTEGHRLDPADWDRFAAQFHALLDQCLDRLRTARARPWRPAPEGFAERIALGQGGDVFARLAEVLPYGTGNTHPRFWGWVHGTGHGMGVAAEMVAATMNANLGGRNHGAIEVEAAVIRWLSDRVGHGGFGVMTTGTSEATILALSAARRRRFPEVRRTGLAGLPQVRVYVAEGGHSCVAKALEVLGHGSDALRRIALKDGRMDLDALEAALDADRAAGDVPLAVVATAGSVNTGTFDPFSDIADLCARRDLWMHVDAAFGLWTMLADAPWRHLVDGVARADSIATDFHKWVGVPYDCGACLIADERLHYATFGMRPEYLVGQAEGLAGGDVWFTDYGIQLSRGFRSLKVWACIEALGVEVIGQAITDNCRQAALMGDLAAASDVLELAQPVVSNVCVFTVAHGTPAEIAAALQLSGEAVFSTTKVQGQDCLRAAIVNHRTTSDDVREAVQAVEREVRARRPA